MGSASCREIQASIDFLANIPLYDDEKPFHYHAPAAIDIDEDKIQTTNIQWDSRLVTLRSMRDRNDLNLETNGFSYVQHKSKCLPYEGSGLDVVRQYKAEAEELLSSLFNAAFVYCYDYKVSLSMTQKSSG